MPKNFKMRARAAGLQGALWKAVQDSGERNVAVILAALAGTLKRVSDMSLDGEADETNDGDTA